MSRSWGRWGASLDITVETGTEEKSRMQHISLLRGPVRQRPTQTLSAGRSLPSWGQNRPARIHSLLFHSQNSLWYRVRRHRIYHEERNERANAWAFAPGTTLSIWNPWLNGKQY